MVDEPELEAYNDLRAIVSRLRSPDGGCPWDLEQTHASLRPFAIQEAYEVVAAIDAGEIGHLPEELGDLLFQVLLHAEIATQSGDWTLTDVYRTLAEKLVRRHPHVFGDATVANSDEVVTQWVVLKEKERGAEASTLQGLPRAAAALGLAQETLGRAAAAGFAWPHKEDIVVKLSEEVAELDRAATPQERFEEFGDILFNLANYAGYIDIDAEEALRFATQKFRRRFEAVETSLRDQGLKIKDRTTEELLTAWAAAKEKTRGE
jgi:MazG family protein